MTITCNPNHYIVIGFGGSARLADVGGVPYMMPKVHREKVICEFFFLFNFRFHYKFILVQVRSKLTVVGGKIGKILFGSNR